MCPTIMALKRKLPQSRWDEFLIVESHSSFEDDQIDSELLESYLSDETDGLGSYSEAGRRRLPSDRVDAAIFASHHAKTKYAETDTINSLSLDLSKKKGKKDIIFDWIDKIFPLFSIGFFFFDITTDIILAVDYYVAESWEYFWWTVGFIVIPSVITCVLGLRLYILDYSREKKSLREGKQMGQTVHCTPTWLWYIRVIMTILQIGPVIRYIEHLYHGFKSQSKKLDYFTKHRHYKISKWDDVDVTMLRLFESFLESAPQLLVQLCILIIDKPDLGDVFTISHKTAAMLSSWLGLCWSLVAYHKTLRRSLEDKENLQLIAIPVYYLWRLVEVGPRVLVFAFFASSYHYWIFVLIGVHWILMSVWLRMQKTAFCPQKHEEVFFNIICGLILVFSFLNVREGHTRYRMLVYYILFYTENLVLLFIWYQNTNDIGEWFHTVGLLTTLISPVVHILIILLYYYCLHPTGNIKLCLTGDRYHFFESVCFTLKEHEAYRQDSEDRKSNPAVEMTGIKQNGNETSNTNHNSNTQQSSREESVDHDTTSRAMHSQIPLCNTVTKDQNKLNTADSHERPDEDSRVVEKLPGGSAQEDRNLLTTSDANSFNSEGKASNCSYVSSV